ncbi:GSCFA domain-containing protein [Flavobacterium alkalisoli]|uniref:GSCFA domain-containing protein n=1 Tax=Flavobacterium alkalisoli TaxID=2602769 RepID=A0A5B9FQA4_9FLAO|nr:GSCFA domain-containing protein [Flavobacterium alkalisoli]QEE48186.1 GSCFA domain-containing protein [Flavobacterium alkalisoli]
MQFRTQIPVSKSNNPISYDSEIVSLGSCFAVNMGEKFNYFKFQNTINPFGILFHPVALKKFIDYSLADKEFTETDIFYHNERWHCFDAHSDLSSTDKEELLANLSNATKNTLSKLKTASHLIVTLGTAWVYRYNQKNELVANCHKVPQKEFSKELLNTTSIKEALSGIINSVKNINPSVNIIFTVSPVRHIKDGFSENQWSKSNLISSVHETIAEVKENLAYFPSYEIMMDELRDYRFYAEDMIHPNQVAIDYIWERFAESHITLEAFTTMKEVDTVQKGMHHRSFNPESEQHKNFLLKLEQKAKSLKDKYPHIIFK